MDADWTKVVWLGLVRNRCLKRLVEERVSMMSNAQRVALLDAAMRSRHPGAYLAGMEGAFDGADRHDDIQVIAALRTLLRAGEIETVMHMRAQWAAQRPAAVESRPDLSK